MFVPGRPFPPLPSLSSSTSRHTSAPSTSQSPLVHNHSATPTAHNMHPLNETGQLHAAQSDEEESPEASLKPFPDDARFPKNGAGSLFFADCLSSRNKYRDDRV